MQEDGERWIHTLRERRGTDDGSYCSPLVEIVLVGKMVRSAETMHTAQAWLSDGETARRARDARVAVDAELAVAEAGDVVGHGGGTQCD
jgi:hypothetical protein